MWADWREIADLRRRCCGRPSPPAAGNARAFWPNSTARSDLYFDAVNQIKLESWSRGRVALVGDAAFCVSLMAGQGSALAMTAAYVLAGELGKAGGRHEANFRNYEARLREFVAMKQRGAERLSAAFAPKTQRGLLLRNLIINACAIPAVAKLAFSREVTDTLVLRITLGGPEPTANRGRSPRPLR